MFKPQFAGKVRTGSKLQTIRPVPKRMPKPGDKISLRAWSGKPYRSKQEVLREAIIEEILPVEITDDGPILDGIELWGLEIRLFAENDGFDTWEDMCEWFRTTHGLPFAGIFISWQNS